MKLLYYETTHFTIFKNRQEVQKTDMFEKPFIEYKGILDKGSIIILPAGKMHRGFKESSGVSFYWLHFNMLFNVPKLPYILKNFSSPHIFRELLHYANLPEINSFVTDSITAYILVQISMCENKNENKSSKLASEIAEWVRINADAQLTVANTAKHFGYNSEHISRVFKNSYKVGIKEYIQNLIVKKAKDYLVNTNYSVEEIPQF